MRAGSHSIDVAPWPSLPSSPLRRRPERTCRISLAAPLIQVRRVFVAGITGFALPMAPAAADLLSGRTVLAARNVKGSARLPVAPARRPGRRGRALGGGPTCAAAVDASAFTAAPASHDGALEAAAASPRRGKDAAAPLARLGALVSAAAGALVPLLHVRRRLIRLLLARCCICWCSVQMNLRPSLSAFCRVWHRR